MTQEQIMEHRWPAIPWREPLLASLIGDGKQHYACRFCVALHGLKGRDIRQLPTSPAAVTAHIAEAHPPWQ